MSIWSKFAGVKAGQANAALTQFAAGQDPNSMGEAALLDLASKLREAQGVVGRRQAALQAANAVVEADKVEVRKLMGTAEVLMKNGDETRASAVMDKVQAANDRLETDKRHLASEQKSADMAQATVDDLEGKLRKGRQSVEDRKRNLSDAKMDREQALEQEALAKKQSGLASSANDFDAVMKAMDDETGRINQEAETAKRMAGSLSSIGGGVEKDPVVVAAMAESEGKSQPTQSVAERLAAARARMADAA